MRRYLGICVSGDSVIIVHVTNDGDQFVIIDDKTWTLQKGDRMKAYAFMHKRIVNYITHESIDHVFIKASAVSRSGVKLSHFKSAEHRGVIMAASASVCNKVTQVKKGVISRTFGDRKTDEYLHDESFWESKIDGKLRKGSREAVFLIMAKLV